MLRELNENEMEMVSGGELVPFNPFLDPTSSLEEQAEAARQYERFFGGGSGGAPDTAQNGSDSLFGTLSGPTLDVNLSCCGISGNAGEASIGIIRVDFNLLDVLGLMGATGPYGGGYYTGSSPNGNPLPSLPGN